MGRCGEGGGKFVTAAVDGEGSATGQAITPVVLGVKMAGKCRVACEGATCTFLPEALAVESVGAVCRAASCFARKRAAVGVGV